MAKTTAKVEETELKAVLPGKYSKQQILKSKKYTGKHDIINALLKDETKYSVAEVDKLITGFMEGTVK